MDFFNNFNFYFNTNLLHFDELLTVFFVFNFFKLIMWSSLLELIWPTQFFNRKNNIFTQSMRFRNFIEFNLKLNSINTKFNVYYNSFIIYFLFKK